MNIVCVGAHPDDCEVYAGGTAVKWARQGHRVLFVSITNGDAGHYAMGGGPLALRRAREAKLSAARGGVEQLVLNHHDGEFEPTLEARREVVGILRRYGADLVLTHRPNDYHPDHRYTSIVVQDAAFMVLVPNFCPEVAPLKQNPVFAYLIDAFRKRKPFVPDVAIDVDEAMDVKWSMLDAMESQFYEWLPWLDGVLDTVPAQPAARRSWLEKTWRPFLKQYQDIARPTLERWYGAQRAASVVYSELFEICEFGRQPTDEQVKALFPF
jgi:N-acetylglucosamine malate deacetylase 1